MESFSVCLLLGGYIRVAYKKAARTKVVTCFIVYAWFGWLGRLKLVQLWKGRIRRVNSGTYTRGYCGQVILKILLAAPESINRD